MADGTLAKVPSGIAGLDDVTNGGLPAGRPTLVCGSAGCGKTLFSVQFLVNGIVEHGEPGVFISFEETQEEIFQNVTSLGWDLTEHERAGVLAFDHIRVEASQTLETGAFDLEGIFIRLGAAIDSVGAKRVVLDTIEALFASLKDQTILRSELRRLFRWLKDRGVTAIITAERGDGALTRHGLEEYVSDWVILLDHRISSQLSTRRLRVVKYRGSSHGSDECPFLIDAGGFRVLPMTSVQLNHDAPLGRVSTGIERLDSMLGGEGYLRGSSILVSGTPGSGKTTLAASFAASGCERGERVLYLAFEESPKQLIRNMASVGIDLQRWIDAGLLTIVATRPSSHGLEAHLSSMYSQVKGMSPSLVIVDPLSAFGRIYDEREAMFIRLVDMLKSEGITALCTSLVNSSTDLSGLGVSSVIDTWLSLTTLEYNGERNRGITIVKSRGMSHSNQIREFSMSSDGVQLRDIYSGSAGVLMGTARQVRETEEAAAARLAAQRIETKRRLLERRQGTIEAQITALRAELEAEVEAIALEIREDELVTSERQAEESALAQARGADSETSAS